VSRGYAAVPGGVSTGLVTAPDSTGDGSGGGGSGGGDDGAGGGTKRGDARGREVVGSATLQVCVPDAPLPPPFPTKKTYRAYLANMVGDPGRRLARNSSLTRLGETHPYRRSSHHYPGLYITSPLACVKRQLTSQPVPHHLQCTSNATPTHPPGSLPRRTTFLPSAQLLTGLPASPPYPTAVAPEARRSGVATSVIQCSERVAKLWGFDELWLHVNIDNPGAQRLYEGLGYIR